uniref:hydrolase n=1 Tax=Lacticaseibacillus suibinensis TaxID=2486011 RepID=UPI001CDBEDB6|nr:hydrolase [Lacticaseibacillus suibinensis]
MSFIKFKKTSIASISLMTMLAAVFAIYSSTQPVEAIEQSDAQTRAAEVSGNTPAAAQTAVTIIKTNTIATAPAKISPIKPGVNADYEALVKKQAEDKAKAEAAAKAKADAEAKAKADAAAKAKAQAKVVAVSHQTTSGVNKGTFKVTFYDPAAMGSSMGYGGIAANLSVLPRGTRVKIQLSNGVTLYRVVNDTGGFAAGNPHQIDVAMPNSQIPAAGVLSATVTIIG